MAKSLTIAALVVSGLGFGQTETVRMVFKGRPTSVQARLATFKEFSFGLEPSQMERLKELTQGKVDFTGIYYADVQNPKVRETLEKSVNYDHSIFPNVPPPAFVRPMAGVMDPELADQWWIPGLGVDSAWTNATGKGVTIADCDAGYFVDEEDINANLLLEHAKDFADVDDPTNISDGNFIIHGTAVTTLMAGVLNGKGTNGIAHDAKVIPLQNYNYADNDDLDKEEATAKCILGALTIPDVDIIVLENQTDGSSETFAGTREAVKLALEAGVIIVSAAGNSGNELKIEEANDTGSIIVGAVGEGREQLSYSNYGSRVIISGYGEGLWTLWGPDGHMAEFGGTSGATPLVAATIAMMLEVNPTLSNDEIKEILIATRKRTPLNHPVGGLVNTAGAVELAMASPLNPHALARRQALRKQIAEVLSH
jgi:subtilisin family serine protease